MQHGANSHCINSVPRWLSCKFQGCIISRNTLVGWQSQSPHLNLIDFYLWGFLAAKVFERQPQSIIGIKEAVSYFVNSIEPETVAEVVKNFRKRVNLCYEMAGQYFQQKSSTIQKFHISSICC